jgi:putative Holliday junction resolvase
MTALVVPLPDLAPLLPPMGALLGLDLGTKTVGLALSDPARRLATPLTTIRRSKFTGDVKELLAIAAEHRVVGLVLGLPVNMDGTEGPRAQATRTFARNLAGLTALPIGLWDERLSTAAAERYLLAADVSRARRAKVIDQHAATFILEGALTRLAGAR